MAKMATVWDRTTEFVSEQAGTLIPLALVALVLPAVVSANLAVVAESSGAMVRNLVAGLQLLLWLVSLWGTLVAMAMAIGAPSLGAAGRQAGTRLVPTLIVTLAFLIGASLLGTPMLLMLASAGYDLRTLAQPNTSVTVDAQTGMWVAVYAIALLVVLVIVFMRLIVINPVILTEGQLFGSVRRSWALTRGHAWRIFGVLVLFAVVASVCQLAAQTVFGSVFALFAGGNAGGFSLATLLTSIVMAMVQALFMLLFAAFQGKLYLALSGEKAGLSAAPIA